MSLATDLLAIHDDVERARTKILAKGGTVTADGGSYQLEDDIDTIPIGITPTGTLSVTENGTYDVTDYASVIVNVSGGGGSHLVTFNAPKNSKIVYSGAESGTIEMGNQTVATATLVDGTYYLESKLTIDSVEQVVFAKTIGISTDQTVNVYPDNTIYWYGVEVIPITGIRGSGFSSPSVVKNDNFAHISVNRGSGTANFTFYADDPIDLTQFGKLRAVYSGAVNGFSRLAYADTANAWGDGTDSTVAMTLVQTEIQTITGSKYVGISGHSSGRSGLTQADVYAIWLE